MTSRSRTARLDDLFDDWKRDYLEPQTEAFHRDGIIDKETFKREERRLLFVTLEANSLTGRYAKYRGRDLRQLLGEEGLGKNFDLNLALWSTALLDGVTEFDRPFAEEARQILHRVAVMNLKKVAGTGSADYCSIGIHAWQDRKRIIEEIEIIDPTVIVACGKDTGRLLHHVLKGDLYSDDQNHPFWTHGKATVIVGNHPFVRPANAHEAFKRLVNRAEEAGVLPVA